MPHTRLLSRLGASASNLLYNVPTYESRSVPGGTAVGMDEPYEHVTATTRPAIALGATPDMAIETHSAAAGAVGKEAHDVAGATVPHMNGTMIADARIARYDTVEGIHILMGALLFCMPASIAIGGAAIAGAFAVLRDSKISNEHKWTQVDITKYVAINCALNAIYYGIYASAGPLFVTVAVTYFVAFKCLFDWAVQKQRVIEDHRIERKSLENTVAAFTVLMTTVASYGSTMADRVVKLIKTPAPSATASSGASSSSSSAAAGAATSAPASADLDSSTDSVDPDNR